MTAPLSLTSAMTLFKQTAKGTPAAAGGVTGRFQQSNLQATYEYIEAQDEHFGGSNLRPTVRKSYSYKSGLLVPFGGMGFVYSDFLGLVFVGLGMADAVTGTTDKTHTFTISERAAQAWVTAIQSLGDGANKYVRRATDGRIEQMRLDVGPQGMTAAFAGVAIDESEATGEEDADEETDLMLLPSKGAATISMDAVAFTGAVRGLRLVMSNPVDRRDQALWSIKRGDLAPTGLEVGLILQGVDMTYDVYQRLTWGGAAGTGPVQGAVRGAADFKFESVAANSGGSLPASLQMILPSLEMRLGNFQARGRDLVRADISCLMIDDVATPLTARLVNMHGDYDGA